MNYDICLKKNDIIEVVIEDIGNDGEGIGHYNGFTLFIKGAVTKDKVKALILKVKKSYGYAKILKILEPSPYRVEPLCPISMRCGGCQLPHVLYEKQLEYKVDKVKNCLGRISGVWEYDMEPVIGMNHPYYYRNKAQFPIGKDKEGNVIIGFYAKNTHSIINSEKCYLQQDIVDTIILKLREFIHTENISIYDEAVHEGLVRHVLIRLSYETGEVMVCLIINGMGLGESKEVSNNNLNYIVSDMPITVNISETKSSTNYLTVPKDKKGERIVRLVDKLKEAETGQDRFRITSICLNKNQDKTNVILGREIIPIYGEAYISEYIGSIKFRISPLSFFQVNPSQTVKLYDKVLLYADLTGREIVWDLYCGIGTISLYIAKEAKHVYGVEVIPQAVEDAVENAKANGILNVEFIAGKAEEILPDMFKREKGIHADVVVIDPPRKGCDEALLDTIADMMPKRIVYVSCDPGTLARDVKYLRGKGYELKRVTVVDQFAMTSHVETVVCLNRIN